MLGETTGLEHIEIKGCRLPKYEQVLICLIPNMQLKQVEKT